MYLLTPTLCWNKVEPFLRISGAKKLAVRETEVPSPSPFTVQNHHSMYSQTLLEINLHSLTHRIIVPFTISEIDVLPALKQHEIENAWIFSMIFHISLIELYLRWIEWINFVPGLLPLQKNSLPKDFGAKIWQSVSSFQRELPRRNKILSSMIWLTLRKRICACNPLEMRKFRN